MASTAQQGPKPGRTRVLLNHKIAAVLLAED